MTALVIVLAIGVAAKVADTVYCIPELRRLQETFTGAVAERDRAIASLREDVKREYKVAEDARLAQQALQQELSAFRDRYGSV